MELKEVLELMQAFSESNVHTLKLEQESFSIKLEKESKQVLSDVIVSQAQPDAVIRQGEVSANVEIPATEKIVKEEGEIISSPMVGTFYDRPSPESEAFVHVGSRVSKGQTLCIIEAMKLMNEIESELDGEIQEIFVENGQLVEYGQPLFRVG